MNRRTAFNLSAALLFAENLERFLAGRPLERVVDPRRGY